MSSEKGRMWGRLFASMFRIGCIGFGGGNALIPVIQKVVVDEERLIGQEAYEEDVVVASITPGALPVEIAGGIGQRLAGWPGLLAGSAGMALPGVCLTLAMLAVMSYLPEGILQQIQFATIGVTAFIAVLLSDYIQGTVRRASAGRARGQQAVLILAVFALTCGKNLYRILGIGQKPFFSLSTIHIFIMTFFLILFTGCSRRRGRLAAGAAVCGLYLLCVGQRSVLPAGPWERILWGGMILLAAWGIWKDRGTNQHWDLRAGYGRIRQTVIELLALLGMTALVFVPSVIVSPHAAVYAGKGVLSSLLSFGGGDAYLTVADGLFVTDGLITESEFYGSVVPIVNVLPGSILCKTLSGIGYFLGLRETGSVGGGILIAVLGFACSLLASCGIFTVIKLFYQAFEQLRIFQQVKRWIRPIVSGLMLTVILSLIYQSRSLGTALELGWLPVLLMGCVYLFDLWLYFKCKQKNFFIVLFSVGASLAACNLAACLTLPVV